LRIDLQHSSNRPIATAFHVHANGEQAGFGRIGLVSWFWRIPCTTCSTPIPLTARLIQPFFTCRFLELHFGHSILSFYIHSMLGTLLSIKNCRLIRIMLVFAYRF
jgi:hypothetical protein